MARTWRVTFSGHWKWRIGKWWTGNWRSRNRRV